MKQPLNTPAAQANNGITSSLLLDGISVIESSRHLAGEENGILFPERHTLMMVLEGSARLTYGKQSITVHQNEMVLLEKATAIHIRKTGNADGIFNSLRFFLNDALLKTFLTMRPISVPVAKEEETALEANAMSHCLVAFSASLKPYFNNPDAVNPGLLKLKIMEMLYDISECNPALFRRILQLRQPARMDIRQIVEQHYASPVTISELASLSGRSLSSFKRDFRHAYNQPPAAWIRERRLEKALEMLRYTALSVSDVCYALGFRNPAHFSRLFKERHGLPPSAILKAKNSLDD
ncbi:MAG: AraC family transcriptional regulator [Alistipes senegalensis]|nr:AraC family transcriptional regulator [Oxalobacter formigenes]MCM1280822.1 AraC family transcriptional regulator [Alistipes senegalensis]